MSVLGSFWETRGSHLSLAPGSRWPHQAMWKFDPGWKKGGWVWEVERTPPFCYDSLVPAYFTPFRHALIPSSKLFPVWGAPVCQPATAFTKTLFGLSVSLFSLRRLLPDTGVCRRRDEQSAFSHRDHGGCKPAICTRYNLSQSVCDTKGPVQCRLRARS